MNAGLPARLSLLKGHARRLRGEAKAAVEALEETQHELYAVLLRETEVERGGSWVGVDDVPLGFYRQWVDAVEQGHAGHVKEGEAIYLRATIDGHTFRVRLGEAALRPEEGRGGAAS